MKKSTLLSLAILTTFGLCSNAYAGANDSVKGYISLLGGAAFQDVSVDCWDDDDWDDSCKLDDETAGTFHIGAGVQIPFTNNYGMRVGIEGFYNTEVTYNYSAYNFYNRRVYDLSTDVSIAGGYVNAAFDVLTAYPVHPYVGFGLGFAKINADTKVEPYYNLSDDDETNFAYHIDVGGIYDITDFLALDLNIRYSNYGDILDNVLVNDAEIDSVDIMAGLKFAF